MTKILSTLKKAERKINFSQLPNRIFEDSQLTVKARFLWILANAMPPHFAPTYVWIQQKMGVKRDAAAALVTQLKKAEVIGDGKKTGKMTGFQFVRFAPTKDFGEVRNQIILDAGLSPEARFLLCAVLCQADTFEPSFSWLQTILQSGRDVARKSLAELVEYGYAMLKRRKANGKWESAYYFADVPNPAYWGTVSDVAKSKAAKTWNDNLSKYLTPSPQTAENLKTAVAHWKHELGRVFNAWYGRQFHFTPKMEKDVRELVYIALRDAFAAHDYQSLSIDQMKAEITKHVFDLCETAGRFQSSKRNSYRNSDNRERLNPAFLLSIVNARGSALAEPLPRDKTVPELIAIVGDWAAANHAEMLKMAEAVGFGRYEPETLMWQAQRFVTHYSAPTSSVEALLQHDPIGFFRNGFANWLSKAREMGVVVPPKGRKTARERFAEAAADDERLAAAQKFFGYDW